MMKKMLGMLLALALACVTMVPALAEVDPGEWIASFEELWAVLEADERFTFEIHPEDGENTAVLSATLGDVLSFTMEELDEDTTLTFVMRTGEVPTDDVDAQAAYDVYYAMAIASALHIRYPDMASENRASAMLLLLDYMDSLRYGDGGEAGAEHETETAFRYEDALVAMWMGEDAHLMTDLMY